MSPQANRALAPSERRLVLVTDILEHDARTAARRGYRWYVFSLCFVLMLLDYMARQVVVSMFPVFKQQWGLSDARLGALVSVVSLAVGVLSVPIAMVADRTSRVKAIALMAVVWSAATAAGAFAHTYEQLLVARFFVGVGEAAYGAAAASLISTVFPVRQRSAAIGSFMSAALFGSVLGVITGGTVGARFGWQAGFWAVGVPGLVLAALFLFLREPPKEQPSVTARGATARSVTFFRGMAEMFRSRSILAAFAANGLLVFLAGTMMSWLPTYFNRVYGLPTPAASVRAAGVILAAGAGSALCGFLVDRLSRRSRRALFLGPAAIAAGVALLMGVAFQLRPGPLQYVLLLIGGLGLVGTQGPMCSAIASLVHPGLRSTGLATLAVVQNVIGLTSGGLLTGMLSDKLGIGSALALVPLAALGAAVFFVAGSRSYERELLAAQSAELVGADPAKVASAGQPSLRGTV
jgi:predicted MFS family arabinose efflux permease